MNTNYLNNIFQNPKVYLNKKTKSPKFPEICLKTLFHKKIKKEIISLFG